MRFAALVSGQGSNLQALIRAEREGTLAPAEVILVLSNRPDAYALERARAAGKATAIVDHRAYPSRDAFETAMLAELDRHRIEAVVLAGFMRILTERFIRAYPGRIINTHPALLPSFPGIHAAQQAIDYGVKVSGCTVHLVDAGVDTGPIIAQAAVPVLDTDDAASLHERIKIEEHALLPQAVRDLAAGVLVGEGRRIRHQGAASHLHTGTQRVPPAVE